ncbi:hypothetical protein PV04_09494 [Phialophora macrospora]|uniref:Transcription factor domain-containing protein n=1 Tax=Phialophora macrospora TaxID=1851006 RepID=A0A0D2FXC8_9EURO|nr:hypothetical protein PV04_09494 [Phialophora macrospora]
MPVTFINRSTRNFNPTSELAAINAHHAYTRHQKRYAAIKNAARRQNAQILSYVVVDEGEEDEDEGNEDNVDDCANRKHGARSSSRTNTHAHANTVDGLLFPPRQIGALRDDPFWTLPVANTHGAMTAFDYHFQVMCPLALGLGNYTERQHQIMRVHVLETAMYCSSMIAFDLVMQSLHMDVTARLSRQAVHHVNNAMAGLRAAVGDPDPRVGTSDIVLATIFPVAVVYRMLNDYTAYNAHVEGVRRIVALRGGLDNLGWEGFLKISAVGMFESADVLRRQQTQRIQDEALGLPVVTHDSVLEYSSPSPPEALRLKISRYPTGVAALALNSRLSAQFLNFFDVFYGWFAATTATPGPHESMTELGHDILGMKGLSFIERVLAVAIQAYINWVERTRREWNDGEEERQARDRCPGG